MHSMFSRILHNNKIEYVDLHCSTVFQILIVLSILPEAIWLLSAENEHDNNLLHGQKSDSALSTF